MKDLHIADFVASKFEQLMGKEFFVDMIAVI